MELGLVTLLRAAWIAATLPIVISLIPSSKLRSFQQFLLGFAKRGKIMQSSSSKLSVPQKLFIHFYILAFAWTTLLLAATWIYAYSTMPKLSEPLLFSSIVSHLTGGSRIFSLQGSHSSKEHRSKIGLSVFLLLLMEAQVLRRLFESIYVFRYSPSARMHIFGYLTGLFFYTAGPLSLCCNYGTEVYKFGLSLIQEFIVKGKDRMLVTEVDWWRFLNPLMQQRWYAWIGAAIFCWGWIHQRRCHAILGSLRENREHSDDYVVPHGDWFQYVSSPHYLAEIVIYAGFVVASGCSDLTICLLWGFVVANLVLAAAETHRWYLHKFDNYPRNRFAIFPFAY
ncbi:PREDICTED: polyprenol reductase 2-like isoform X2 [Nicotiana attenuata]|nr:PREDICTED: polyprenol reductase 2-like isoform X2 [Nicotiana attenuata]XP_019231010.1 PREDICTED: polyprenol reductase 2-like isoform X2 [Nicotiana attenuata]XP_019231613.1 PREDICTED: polyprenol reductase 2-like isoform X2 [Nicotiana attenuata]XP_019232249.1 PREDICTED: polyprenol reductase 2-like isoform X2 [Nicotiana attenuata]XP_019232867.1 PREDICTED: polyprenol reductase 2-like isoform X2 [Nicotiana attenuata]XP_019233473.1 PREDICTED: polyprenol reductase 2-like isoform X2 [Nicotiana atte